MAANTAKSTPVENTPATTNQTGETVAAAKSLKFSAETLTQIKTAPAWRPKDGETIEGEIVTIAKRTGEFGPYPMVVLDTGATKFTAVHAFHGVLLNELKELKAGPGMNITILYTGKRTANRLNADGSEKQYHGYSVVPADGGEMEIFDFSS